MTMAPCRGAMASKASKLVARVRLAYIRYAYGFTARQYKFIQAFFRYPNNALNPSATPAAISPPYLDLTDLAIARVDPVA